MPAILEHYAPPQAPYLDVLYEDDALLVLNKQSGLLSVPGKNPEHADCLETRAQQTYADALLVHRLDMETSGVFLMARSKEAQRHLGFQFEKRRVEKRYIARVAGHLTEDAGTIDLPLICDWPNRPRQMVDHEHGKQAVTHWRMLKHEQHPSKTPSTLVELKPETGRSHQLRVHMLAIGHPILGDSLYGDEIFRQAANRLQLHAEKLAFWHPVTKEPVEFMAPHPF